VTRVLAWAAILSFVAGPLLLVAGVWLGIQAVAAGLILSLIAAPVLGLTVSGLQRARES
jgi:hypothetical protein